ncbi:Rha family transcriptional regulator [Acinetobacter wanghuae]|uniref:Rha family transcriptional regulator n=1 Tax=Acinetobacter wanghuae TaxID=2662362 RepID=A0A5Q0P4Y9_9GAMM|nr:Rha family transcriptional regulator [Acinetobacter wanghuae]MQW93382.1 Rha family transcriptional regulator [Acinetobacter wanghuae]QGA10778.1 Rha family transcriptional regulator [Acinetobacter wanghuae]
MKNLVTLKHGLLITTDLLIAQAFNKRPSDVKHAIRKLECPDEFRQRNFTLTSYLDIQGKTRPCYEITRDGFILLVMSFTGKKAMDIKLKYIEAFNLMEKELHNYSEIYEKVVSYFTLRKNEISSCAREMAHWKREKPHIQHKIYEIEQWLQLSLDLEQ